MDFFQQLSTYYDLLFPFKKSTFNFVKSQLRDGSVLDVGCGTGNMSLALIDAGYDVTAIDLDVGMLHIARSKDGRHQSRFIHVDMTKIGEQFADKRFENIICLGNTLVQLDELEKINLLLKKFSNQMVKGGKLILQIVNYDRVLDGNNFEFPIIDCKNVKFERSYRIGTNCGRFKFTSRITDKKTNEVFTNQVVLYPLRKGKLEEILFENGFGKIHFYGNFYGDNFSSKQTACIVCAEKNDA